jgi:hypothetical protein
MGGYTRAVSGQQLGERVHAATDANATIEELCFLCGPCGGVILKITGATESVDIPVRESVKRGLERVKLKNLHC